MLRRMAAWGETHDCRLILGVNRTDEVFATDELAVLRQDLPGLRTVVAVLTPDPTWSGAVGTAVDALGQQLAQLGEAERPDIYLCGPPGFLDAARAAAAQWGVPTDQVYEERILSS
jgi:ferredoxin-NADP reductase